MRYNNWHIYTRWEPNAIVTSPVPDTPPTVITPTSIPTDSPAKQECSVVPSIVTDPPVVSNSTADTAADQTKNDAKSVTVQTMEDTISQTDSAIVISPVEKNLEIETATAETTEIPADNISQTDSAIDISLEEVTTGESIDLECKQEAEVKELVVELLEECTLVAPVIASVLAPVIAPVDPPVVAAVIVPIVAAVLAPVIAPVDTPVIAPVDTPVIAPVAPPVVAPVDQPVVTPVDVRVVVPAVTAVVAPVYKSKYDLIDPTFADQILTAKAKTMGDWYTLEQVEVLLPSQLKAIVKTKQTKKEKAAEDTKREKLQQVRGQSISRFICGVLYYTKHKAKYEILFTGDKLNFELMTVKTDEIEKKVKWWWINQSDELIECNFPDAVMKFMKETGGDLSNQNLSKDPNLPNKFKVEIIE